MPAPPPNSPSGPAGNRGGRSTTPTAAGSALRRTLSRHASVGSLKELNTALTVALRPFLSSSSGASAAAASAASTPGGGHSDSIGAKEVKVKTEPRRHADAGRRKWTPPNRPAPQLLSPEPPMPDFQPRGITRVRGATHAAHEERFRKKARHDTQRRRQPASAWSTRAPASDSRARIASPLAAYNKPHTRPQQQQQASSFNFTFEHTRGPNSAPKPGPKPGPKPAPGPQPASRGVQTTDSTAAPLSGGDSKPRAADAQSRPRQSRAQASPPSPPPSPEILRGGGPGPICVPGFPKYDEWDDDRFYDPEPVSAPKPAEPTPAPEPALPPYPPSFVESVLRSAASLAVPGCRLVLGARAPEPEDGTTYAKVLLPVAGDSVSGYAVAAWDARRAVLFYHRATLAVPDIVDGAAHRRLEGLLPARLARAARIVACPLLAEPTGGVMAAALAHYYTSKWRKVEPACFTLNEKMARAAHRSLNAGAAHAFNPIGITAETPQVCQPGLWEEDERGIKRPPRGPAGGAQKRRRLGK